MCLVWVWTPDTKLYLTDNTLRKHLKYVIVNVEVLLDVVVSLHGGLPQSASCKGHQQHQHMGLPLALKPLYYTARFVIAQHRRFVRIGPVLSNISFSSNMFRMAAVYNVFSITCVMVLTVIVLFSPTVNENCYVINTGVSAALCLDLRS